MSSSCGNQFCNSQKDLKLHELLLNKEYSLNAVNNYGDSLLHVCAAYGCAISVKIILNQNKNSTNIDRKNKFGWTPLMIAIRGDNMETVKVLIENGADVTQRNYLGTSTLTLAAGIGLEMFETIYKARPSMLKASIHDDITPLCVAAMKNDKKLFFKLINLGMEVNNENVYTHLVMRESVFPEIESLAKPQTDIEDYWNNQSDNIQIVGKESAAKSGDRGDLSSFVNSETTRNSLPSIFVDSPKEEATNLIEKSLNSRKETNLPNLDLVYLKEEMLRENQSISPNLIYNLDSWFAKSPNLSNSPNPILTSGPKETQSHKSCPQRQQTQRDFFVFENVEENPLTVNSEYRAQDVQSTIPRVENHNISLTFIPEFSPSRSPCLPSDFEDEDVCGEDTPTPPHYKTPPQGMVLNSEQAKLVIILKQFDLTHLISTFLAEEVDMDLFLTLNNQDLAEIGVKNEGDRKALLAIIDAYTKHDRY